MHAVEEQCVCDEWWEHIIYNDKQAQARTA